jgi:hypothetical protein
MNHTLFKNIFTSFVTLLIIVFGFYLCFIGGYGSDEDTLPMMHVFEARLDDGRFVSSRFASNPIPEIGIGFLSYYFGSWAVNSVTFILHLLSLCLIYFSFFKKINFQKFKIFLILCLSSPVLFFDNLEPIDYSWAFVFFALGTFFLSRRIFELAILAFAFAIGSRINFLIFSIIVIFFFNYDKEINIKKKFIISFCTFIVGGLFYLPIWFENAFGLEWITAARPVEQGLYGLFARFAFKTWMAIGVFQTFLIIFLIKKYIKRVNYIEVKPIFLVIISNLLIFFYIPAELSYLQPALILMYLVIVKEVNKNLIILLIIFNFFNWALNFQILDINYKDNSVCGPKEAISADLDIKLIDGSVKNFLSSRQMIACWVNDTERGKRILEGKSTRISK